MLYLLVCVIYLWSYLIRVGYKNLYCISLFFSISHLIFEMLCIYSRGGPWVDVYLGYLKCSVCWFDLWEILIRYAVKKKIKEDRAIWCGQKSHDEWSTRLRFIFHFKTHTQDKGAHYSYKIIVLHSQEVFKTICGSKMCASWIRVGINISCNTPK